jgi:hypothetical protein
MNLVYNEEIKSHDLHNLIKEFALKNPLLIPLKPHKKSK